MFPVIGDLKDDPTARRLGTGFLHFENQELGIDGLARVNGSHVKILAVYSINREVGNFARFVTELLAAYERVTFCCIMSGVLVASLKKRGFETDYSVPKDERPALTWTKPS